MSDWAATRRLPVEILLAEGVTLRGDMHLQPRVANHEGTETPLELPPNRARTLDYLNTSGRFFAVSNDTETRYLNRSHVALVRPFD